MQLTEKQLRIIRKLGSQRTNSFQTTTKKSLGLLLMNYLE